MGIDPVTLGIASLAVGVVSGVASYSQQKDAADAQKEAQAYQQRLQKLRQDREKRDAVRQARILRSKALNTSASTGTQGSSGLEGALSSIGTQLGSNMSFLDQQGSLANTISGLNQQAADSQSMAGLFSGLSSLGFSVAGSDLFKESATKPVTMTNPNTPTV